jgi:hypothetical protein
MRVATVVRYTTTPEAADENQRLVQAVYAELAAADPGTIQYATFRLDDGVSFVHVAIRDPDDNPLSRSAAFAAFQAGLMDRCAVPPAPAGATVVGSYGFGMREE